jgi:hypothetical protein
MTGRFDGISPDEVTAWVQTEEFHQLYQELIERARREGIGIDEGADLKLHAAALLKQQHDLGAGSIPERIWRTFYVVQRVTPEQAA